MIMRFFLVMVLSFSLPRLAIIELDKNEELRVIWYYPSLSKSTASFLLSSCHLKSGGGSLDINEPEFTCTRFDGCYHYVLSVRLTPPTLDQVIGVSLIILSDKFEPQKNSLLGTHLLSAYFNSGNTLPVMKIALQLATKGETKLSDKDTLKQEALNINAPTRLANILAEFDSSSIHLYTAMVLHKRIIIHADPSSTTKDDALSFIISLLSLLPVSSNYPDIYASVCDIESPDYTELLTRPWYIAVVFDSRISNVLSNTSSGFDLLISYEKSTLIFSDSAKDSFSTGKLHKEIAKQWADAPKMEEEDIINKMRDKTGEVLTQLSTICSSQPEHQLSESVLRDLRLAPATAQFLLNLARVHGFDVIDE